MEGSDESKQRNSEKLPMGSGESPDSDPQHGLNQDNEDRQSDTEYPEVGGDNVFAAKEKNLYRRFCHKMIFYHVGSPRIVRGRPSSPFRGANNEVSEKFRSFLSEIPGEENDMVYLRLRNDPDEVTVALLNEEIRELESREPFEAAAQHIDSYLYCRLRLFPNEIQQRVHRCSAYRINLNMYKLSDWTDATPLQILEEILDEEMKEVDFNIIPLLYGEHWTLAIVCGLGLRRDANLPSVPWRTPCILYFNSVEGNVECQAGIVKSHGYAIARAVAKKARINLKHVAWHQIASPQQSNDKDCGFYVMRFAVEFLNNIDSPEPLPVHDLFHQLLYAPKLDAEAKHQLRGFIASVNREKRDWITELSGGKPACTIDIRSRCIPRKIIEAGTNEYKVEMANNVRPDYVSPEYLMEHWPHLYDDYIKRINGRKGRRSHRGLMKKMKKMCKAA